MVIPPSWTRCLTMGFCESLFIIGLMTIAPYGSPTLDYSWLYIPYEYPQKIAFWWLLIQLNPTCDSGTENSQILHQGSQLCRLVVVNALQFTLILSALGRHQLEILEKDWKEHEKKETTKYGAEAKNDVYIYMSLSCFLLYYIISYHIISYNILLCYTMYIVWYRIISHHITANNII